MKNSDKIADKVTEKNAVKLNDSDLEKVTGGSDIDLGNIGAVFGDTNYTLSSEGGDEDNPLLPP